MGVRGVVMWRWKILPPYITSVFGVAANIRRLWSVSSALGSISVPSSWLLAQQHAKQASD